MSTSETRTLRFMLMCLLFMVTIGMAYDALAQDETPEAQPEATATAPLPPDVVVNVEAPAAPDNDVQSAWNFIYIVVGVVLGGGGVWIISPRIRANIENDKTLMDSLERKYNKGNAATRAVLDKAAVEARGWLDFYDKIRDGKLNDGTQL